MLLLQFRRPLLYPLPRIDEFSAAPTAHDDAPPREDTRAESLGEASPSIRIRMNQRTISSPSASPCATGRGEGPRLMAGPEHCSKEWIMMPVSRRRGAVSVLLLSLCTLMTGCLNPAFDSNGGMHVGFNSTAYPPPPYMQPGAMVK